MAFIDFTPGSTVSIPDMPTRTPSVIVSLSRTVAAAADIGAHDPLSSLRRERPLDRWMAALFGIRRAASLADPMLEAVRRLSVASHLGRDQDVADELPAAIAAGVGMREAIGILARFSRSSVASAMPLASLRADSALA